MTPEHSERSGTPTRCSIRSPQRRRYFTPRRRLMQAVIRYLPTCTTYDALSDPMKEMLKGIKTWNVGDRKKLNRKDEIGSTRDGRRNQKSLNALVTVSFAFIRIGHATSGLRASSAQ